MTLSRPPGTAGRRLEIDLLRSVTRDHAYYNRLPTGEYPVHINEKHPARTSIWTRTAATGLVLALGVHSIAKPLPNHEPAQHHANEHVMVANVAETNTLEDVVATYIINAETRAFFNETIPYALEMEERYGVPAELSLAKAIIESRSGSSELARKGNNYFGMKESKTFKRDYPRVIIMSTKEELNGEVHTVRARFTRYNSPRESFEHFARVVTRFYSRALDTNNPHEMAERLNKAGYSTASDATVATSRALREYRLPALLGDLRRLRTPQSALADD